MAVRGTKPKSPALKLVTGNPGKRPIADESAPEIEVREKPLEPHRKLTKAQRFLWDRFINTAWWLNEHDVAKAYMWVCLQVQFEKKPEDMNSNKIGQLRILGSELGLDQSARARLGINGGTKKDPADKFFS